MKRSRWAWAQSRARTLGICPVCGLWLTVMPWSLWLTAVREAGLVHHGPSVLTQPSCWSGGIQHLKVLQGLWQERGAQGLPGQVLSRLKIELLTSSEVPPPRERTVMLRLRSRAPLGVSLPHPHPQHLHLSKIMDTKGRLELEVLNLNAKNLFYANFWFYRSPYSWECFIAMDTSWEEGCVTFKTGGHVTCEKP